MASISASLSANPSPLLLLLAHSPSVGIQASLENLFPLVRAVAGRSGEFYNYLNSYAIELGDVGRLDEANAALNVALGSPFAASHPYWKETRVELETKRRHPRSSFVSLSSSTKPETREPPKSQKKKRQCPKCKRIRVAVIVRALHWLAGLSIFTSVSSALILAKSISVDPDALLSTTSDWLTSGPGPRAPPTIG